MLKTKVLDHGYLGHVQSWGSDESIVEAARMSTGKGFLGWGPMPCPECSTEPGEHGSGCLKCNGTGTVSGDEKLLRFLWENKHATPFEMGGMIVEVQAPIMVFREWQRHRTQSYNEQSGRYVEIPELFYVPSAERMRTGGQSTSNKQGSGVALEDEFVEMARDTISSSCRDAFNDYHNMLRVGVAREIARLVLPVNTYSRMRASANLRNWLAFLTLRTDPAAQWEIRQFAVEVGKLIERDFPRTWALFNKSVTKEGRDVG